MEKEVICIIIVVFTFLYLYPYQKKKKKELNLVDSFTNGKIRPQSFENTNKLIFNSDKPFIWIYLEEFYNSLKWPSFGSRLTINNMESYLILCLYSIYKHCHSNFNIIVLNDININKYLPDLNISMGPNSTIPLDRRKNLICFKLLYLYGGIWMNPDTIVMKDLLPTYKLLDQFQLIAFGCPSDEYLCNKGYLKPQTSVIMSLPGLRINYLCFSEIYKKISSYNYPAYEFNETGDCIFWKYLKQQVFYGNLNFLHLSSEFNGTRDYNHKLIGIENWLSTNRTYFIDQEKVLFVSLSNQKLNETIVYKWFIRFSLYQIINSDLWIAYLFRLSLGIKEKYYYNNDFRDTNIENKSFNAPPVNLEQLNKLFYNCNYFATSPWEVVFNQ